MAEYIQVGVTALRDPMTGGFTPAVPLFIQSTPETMKDAEKMIEDFGRLLAHRMKREAQEASA